MRHFLISESWYFNKGFSNHQIQLFELIEELGYKYKVQNISQDDLFSADEVFYCGSASEVTPIKQIDNHKVGNGKSGLLTLKLQEKYYNIVRGREEKYFKWLSFISD